ncbi:MAG TPA: peptidoglycan DD-metalloendopeptidase family protein [Bacteroidales bacterium]|jgi:septal ring factor EnvC (AmiA/AmiB activator)|nr:peptidoglycan DD-metalloendopeptidase family protein [Bacteroidales bacterium]
MRVVFFALIAFFTVFKVSAQTRSELETQRKKTLEEIGYVDNMLKTTSREKTESMNAVKILGKKVSLRESVISGMRQEISLLSDRIDLNTTAIELMEDDLTGLKKEYSITVLNSYKTGKGYPELIYVLSAKDFNQGYKRLKYLQQVSKFRRREAEIILELKEQIQVSRGKLQADLSRMSDLKSREEQQKILLQTEQQRSQKMVKSLNTKEKQLRKQLEEKKKTAKRIEAEIAKLIAEERKKAESKAETPEQKLIGDNFAENKGRLPWPVEKGLITSHFGVQKNAVLKYVQEENIGIEITSSGRMAARSIFKGEVTRVFPIQGSNMTVIIKHGKYFTVYNNVVNVKVKPGDKVDTKQYIGDVYSDPSNNNICVLEFMIYETKFHDPEAWIAKN